MPSRSASIPRPPAGHRAGRAEQQQRGGGEHAVRPLDGQERHQPAAGQRDDEQHERRRSAAAHRRPVASRRPRARLRPHRAHRAAGTSGMPEQRRGGRARTASPTEPPAPARPRRAPRPGSGRDGQAVQADGLPAPLRRGDLGRQRRAEHGQDGEARAPDRRQRADPGHAVVEHVERRRHPHGDQPGHQDRARPRTGRSAPGWCACTAIVTTRKTAVTSPRCSRRHRPPPRRRAARPGSGSSWRTPGTSPRSAPACPARATTTSARPPPPQLTCRA